MGALVPSALSRHFLGPEQTTFPAKPFLVSTYRGTSGGAPPSACPPRLRRSPHAGLHETQIPGFTLGR